MRTPIILRVYKSEQLVEVKQFDLDQVVVGREADVQLQLPSDDVSPIHCLIERRDSSYYICDLGSKSGTKKNKANVLDESIQSGDEIEVGPFKIVFYQGVPKPKAPPQMVQASASMAPDAKPAVADGAAAVTSQVSAASAMATTSTEVMASTADVSAPQVPKTSHVKSEVKTTDAEKVSIPSKPVIKDKKSIKSSSKKNKKTFAPPSEISDLRNFLKPSKGAVVEVIVSWKERVLETFHFRTKGSFKLGSSESDSIRVPTDAIQRGWNFLDIGSIVKVNISDAMSFELISSTGVRKTLDHCITAGKAQKSSTGTVVRLDQNEMIWISLGQIQLFVRFSPQTGLVPLLPPLGLTGTEMSGVVLSVMLTALLAFYISATTPKDLFEEEEQELTRTAQVIFNTPPKPPAEEIPPVPTPPVQEVKPPPPEKAKATDEKKETQKKGQKTDLAASNRNERAGRASEVAPIPNSQNRPKKFTSTKQGGAIKIGDKAGSNAASTKDMSKVGMFGALSGGGIRAKLDQAYSGAGEVLGQADRATGTTGFGENRPGDDLGSKFKDTGAGGKGTATQGIAGIGTRGRGSGQSAYGSLDGFGSRNVTIVDPGDSDEDFVGTIDREAIRRRVRHYLHEIRGCYNRELSKLEKGQVLEGKVVIQWEIIAQGIPKNVKVKSSTLGNRAVENCIRDRLASWSFPEPPRGMTAEVSYPFYMKPEN